VAVRGRGADVQFARAPLDHRVLVLLVDAPVDDRVLGREFQLPYLALAVDAMPRLELFRTEVRLPFTSQFFEPELQGMWGVDALGSVRLHPAKSGDRRIGLGVGNLNSCQSEITLATFELYVDLLPCTSDRSLIRPLPRM